LSNILGLARASGLARVIGLDVAIRAAGATFLSSGSYPVDAE